MENALVFGRGKFCKSKLPQIKDKYNVIGFLDNAVSDKEYDYDYNAYVYPVRDVIDFNDCKIICMSIYFCEMYHQLINMGVNSERIEVGIHYEPLDFSFDKALFSYGEYIEVDKNGLI